MLNNRELTNKFFTFNILLICWFFILGFIGILNHELWQDEIQAWIIVRDSSSIADLLKNLKYEDHTALWYLCLRFSNGFTYNPFIMQVFHLALATISIAIFVAFSPFSKLQKILFTFNYFPFYKYNILSKNYKLGALLIFSFCALFYSCRKSYFPLAIILALLAHTNIFGLILTIVLQLTLLLEIFMNTNAYFNNKKWDFIASLSIVIIGILGVIIQLRPPVSGVQGNLIAPDTTTWQTIFAQVSDLNRLMELISNVWQAYFSIYQFSPLIESITLILLSIILFSITFRNLNKQPAIKFLYLVISALFVIVIALDRSNKFIILEAINTPALLGSLVSFAILFFFGLWFIKQPVILFLYISGILSIFLFTYSIEKEIAE